MNDDAILKVYEAPARIYCAKVGIDPDMQMPGTAVILGARKLIPVWHGVAFEMYDLSLRLTAIREASAPKPVVQ